MGHGERCCQHHPPGPAGRVGGWGSVAAHAQAGVCTRQPRSLAGLCAAATPHPVAARQPAPLACLPVCRPVARAHRGLPSGLRRQGRSPSGRSHAPTTEERRAPCWCTTSPGGCGLVPLRRPAAPPDAGRAAGLRGACGGAGQAGGASLRVPLPATVRTCCLQARNIQPPGQLAGGRTAARQPKHDHHAHWQQERLVGEAAAWAGQRRPVPSPGAATHGSSGAASLDGATGPLCDTSRVVCWRQAWQDDCCDRSWGGVRALTASRLLPAAAPPRGEHGGGRAIRQGARADFLGDLGAHSAQRGGGGGHGLAAGRPRAAQPRAPSYSRLVSRRATSGILGGGGGGGGASSLPWIGGSPGRAARSVQAFINTAREIYKKIQDGVLDVSNEVTVGAGVCRRAGWGRRVQRLLAPTHGAGTPIVGPWLRWRPARAQDGAKLRQLMLALPAALCSRMASRSGTARAAPARPPSSLERLPPQRPAAAVDAAPRRQLPPAAAHAWPAHHSAQPLICACPGSPGRAWAPCMQPAGALFEHLAGCPAAAH